MSPAPPPTSSPSRHQRGWRPIPRAFTLRAVLIAVATALHAGPIGALRGATPPESTARPTAVTELRGTAMVAAASDLVFCLEDLVQSFTNRHPAARIQSVTGSSGNFFAQIKRGAPFDLFLSADMAYAQALATNGLADPSSLRPYATGRLVLWSMRPDAFKSASIPAANAASASNGTPAVDAPQAWAILTSPWVRRVAMANPDHAPYGRAARESLRHAGLWEAIQPRLVLGDNISQAAQFVQSGNAEVGLVALSLVSAPRMQGRGSWWLIPETAHAPLIQGLVLTRRGSTNQVALALARHLETPAAREILARHGFQAPPATPVPTSGAGEERR